MFSVRPGFLKPPAHKGLESLVFDFKFDHRPIHKEFVSLSS